MAVSSFAVLPPFRYSSTTDRSSSSKLLRISQYRSNPRYPNVLVSCSLNQPSDDASDAALFLESNSIADYMRFKRRPDAGNGTSELQTAIVSYKKRFPWILLNPFLQVTSPSLLLSGFPHISRKVTFLSISSSLYCR